MRPYILVFFVGGALCVGAEQVTGTLLGAYEVRSGLTADPTRDTLLTAFLVSTFVHPGMALIHVRLARRHPLAVALTGAFVLGLLEIWFLRHGYLRYRVWHPAVSVTFYFAFLMANWQVFSGRWVLPAWVHVVAMAFWVTGTTTHLLHSVLGLWQYPVTMRGDPILGSHVVANLYELLPLILMAAFVSLVRSKWPRPLLVLAGALVLLAAQALLLATGGVQFVKWSLWLSALRYPLELGAVALYARWIFP
ncbi:MAG TPA: hypothetical protein VD969_02910 [Symbiobacteriaceae bacterium]|nr:hypothetical protein [Symbiobacteriaceae bacterium]